MIVLKDAINQSDMCNPTQEVIDIYSHVPEITELDNRGKTICRPLFSHSSFHYALHLNKEVWLVDWDGEEEFVYLAHTHHNQRLWVKHINLIPKQVIDGVKNRKGYLLFDNTLEGNRVDGEWFLEPFYKNMKELDLPPNRVIFVTNNFLAEKTHETWFENQETYSEKMKIISFMWNVHDVKRLIQTKNLPTKVVMDDEIKYKSNRIDKIKHFLKINRTNRSERNIFMLFMNHHNLLEKSLVSFPHLPEDTYPNGFEKYLTQNNIQDLQSKVPFNIDRTDKDNQGPAGHGKGFFDADLPFQPIHYKNSFVSVVMGAFPFEPNACHLHSSTFNPMYCGQPIIQFGPYQSLKEMRERGFKTIGKWWDESYDDEHDGWKRLQKVMDVTLQISKLSNKEMLRIFIDMKDVLQHNVDLISNFDVKTQLHDRLFDDRPQT